MFGMSWGEIAIILAVGMFVLGPERIPVAVKWVGSTLKTVRTMAAGAQEQLRGEFGPELDELRRQIADLQSLKEIQELRSLRDLNPRSMITKNILGEEFSGGVKGMLGLDGLADMIKPTGSGVAAEPPAVDLGKSAVADVRTNGGADGPAAAPPIGVPVINDPPATFPPAINEPAINEPAPVDHYVEINEPVPAVAEAPAVDLGKTDATAVPRHAAPSSFDFDAT